MDVEEIDGQAGFHLDAFDLGDEIDFGGHAEIQGTDLFPSLNDARPEIELNPGQSQRLPVTIADEFNSGHGHEQGQGQGQGDGDENLDHLAILALSDHGSDGDGEGNGENVVGYGFVDFIDFEDDGLQLEP